VQGVVINKHAPLKPHLQRKQQKKERKKKEKEETL
jgi:hypothetical protein